MLSFTSSLIVLFVASMQATTMAFAPMPVSNRSNNGAMDRNRGVGSELFVSTVQAPTTTTSVIEPITVEPVTEVIGTRPRIQEINSAEEMKVFLQEGQEDEEERLAIIKFHASWCKSCQKFGHQFKGIAREIGDLEEVTLNDDDEEEATIIQQGELRMGEIEYGANSDLCKSLGVTKLPAVQVYSSKRELPDVGKQGSTYEQ